MALPGGMISFELKGGKAEGAVVMDNVKLCKLAVSLGDAETSSSHAASIDPFDLHAGRIKNGRHQRKAGPPCL